MGIVKFLTVRLVEVIVILLLIIFMPNLPPKVNFSSFKVTPSAELKGKLALNERLKGAEHIFKDQLKGAEAFAEYNGELYSGLYTGEVVKFSKGHIVPIVQFGRPCAGHFEEAICGRPLGLQFDRKGNLFAIDSYTGIWKVDVKTGQKTLLVPMDKEIEGKKPMLPNAITLSENGDFYWTDSAADFTLQDGIFTFLADATGRLIHYNAKTKINKVLMDGIHFANGVMLSKNEDFVIVNECARSRIYRFYLKGPKAGTHDIFADGLPGLPDNINSDGQDGFFVSLIVARDVDHPTLSQVIGPFPLIRKLLARILGLIELSFKTVNNIYPNVYAQMGIHSIGHLETVTFLLPKRVTILRYSQNGELLESLHTTDGSLTAISEAFIFDDHLYLGSPYNNYIGKISLEKAGLQHLRKKRETIKIQTSAPAAAPVKKSSPSTEAPIKQATPKPTQAPTKQIPKATEVPLKQAPPPVKNDEIKSTAATPKQGKEATVKQPTPTAAPVKKSSPTPAPQKESSPTPAPQKQPPSRPTPQKQSSPPPVPQKQTTAAPVKSSPTPAPAKQVPSSPTPAPAKKPSSSSTPAPQKQSPPTAAPIKQNPTTEKPVNKKVEKEAPKIVPIKENTVPKSESIRS